jgi:hypothetical protein
MEVITQQNHIYELFEVIKKNMIGKGNDYANADRLSNFKLSGAIIGITPEQQCLSLIATKVARLGNLFKKQHINPNNESIKDSTLDLICYGILLDMIITEKQVSGQPELI